MIRTIRLLAAVSLLAVTALAGLAGCSNPETPAPGPGSGGTGGGGQLSAASPGAEVFRDKCQGCHGATGQGASGPALAAFAGETEANLRRVIENGDGKMPAFKGQLTDEQIGSVVAHVKTLGG